MTGVPQYRRSKLKEFLLYPLRGRQAHAAQLRRVPERLPIPQQPDKPGILHRLRLMALDAALPSAHLHPFRLRQLPALVQSVPDVLPFHFGAEAKAADIYCRNPTDLSIGVEQAQILLLKIKVDSVVDTSLDTLQHLPYLPAEPGEF